MPTFRSVLTLLSLLSLSTPAVAAIAPAQFPALVQDPKRFRPVWVEDTDDGWGGSGSTNYAMNPDDSAGLVVSIDDSNPRERMLTLPGEQTTLIATGRTLLAEVRTTDDRFDLYRLQGGVFSGWFLTQYTDRDWSTIESPGFLSGSATTYMRRTPLGAPIWFSPARFRDDHAHFCKLPGVHCVK